MRNLPAPTSNAIDVFRKITASKSETIRARLIRVRPVINQAYTNYEVNCQKLEAISSAGIKGVKSAALIHAYSSKTSAMSALRTTLLDPGIEDFDKCPYCGISEPKTLDHYLPKEGFPEFSVLPANLIPICNACNSTFKGSKFLSDAGDRLFLHSYFDIFPAFHFVKVEIVVAAEIEIKFGIREKVENLYFSNLLKNHFEQLGLKERFLRKSAAEISRKRATLNRIYGAAQNHAAVAAALTEISRELHESTTGNNWEAALYNALALSLDFCDGGFLKKVRLG